MSKQPFVIKNQFGEESINYILNNIIQLQDNVCFFPGPSAPVNGTTGLNFAGPGSLYVALDSGLAYQQTGLISSPVWVATGSASTSALLTGFVSGAGVVATSDTILQAFNKLVGNQTKLQNGTPTLGTETVASAGAISTTVPDTLVNNGTAGTYAATLAAPSSQDGQLKVIKMGTATHTVTLAMTNIAMSGAYTPTGTTTLTFTNTGDSAVLLAVGSKWVYLGGSAVAS